MFSLFFNLQWLEQNLLRPICCARCAHQNPFSTSEPRALIVDNFYRDIPFPFTNVQWYFSHEGLDTTGLGSVSSRPFMEENMTIDQFETYIKTWSAYTVYLQRHPDAEDPVERMMRKLEQAIGVNDRDTETFTVRWPTVLIVAENDK